MKLLITGAKGQLGWDLVQQAQASGHTVHAFTHAELDIRDGHQVATELQKFKPDVLINAAAYTAVDKAEQEPELAYAINSAGPKILALACAAADIPLVHVSTDYIFDGEQTRPYLETDAAAPLNIYGQSKWAGEQAIREHSTKYFIVRVSGVFGSHGQNFVKTILRLAQEREELRIVNDQITCPTPATAIAQALLTLLSSSAYGTYHFCSNEPTSWFTFAEAIIAQAKMPLKIKNLMPIPSSEYPTPAKRPLYSVLDCQKIQSTFNLQLPSWREGLMQVLREIQA